MNGKTLICLAVIAVAYSKPGTGAEPTGEAHPGCDLKIDTQPLGDALKEIARQCDLQMVYFSEITAGLTASQISGHYTIDDALHLLLDRTGLTFRHIAPNTIGIEQRAPAAAITSSGRDRATRKPPHRPPQPENSSELPEVVVNATAEGLVATRIETPLRDIPQTFSVISAEQIRQQNNFDLGSALDDVVGITSLQSDSRYRVFYSRGFEISSYTLDGGGSLDPFHHPVYANILLVPDLAEFDHVEVLRGANALFGADGLPGGAVNLVRKRPLDTATIMSASSAGSWNNYRQEIDATGPIALDGALRGRLDVTYGRQDYFYKFAYDEHGSAFGTVDYDLAPDTVLTAGGSFNWDRGLPFKMGLPGLSDGRDPHLPRSTAYTFNWSRYETRVGEAYLRLDQTFGVGWRLQANATLLDRSLDYAYGTFFTPIDALTGGILVPPNATYSSGPAVQRQFNLEVTLTGSAELLGHHEEFAFGGDFRHAHSHILEDQSDLFGAPLANAYQFDPAVYPDPRGTAPVLIYDDSSSNILAGLFGSLRIQLVPRWSVVAGLRVSNERIVDDTVYYFAGQGYPSPGEYAYTGKVTPYAGTVFAINSTYSVYASYADIYQSATEVVGVGAARPPPIDGIDMELGLKGAWRDGALNGALAVYKIVERGVSQYDPNNVPVSKQCCYSRDGKELSRGVDIELNGKLTARWLIGAGYTFTNHSEEAYGQIQVVPQSLQIPRHLLKVWTSFGLPGRWYHWSIGGTLRAQSATYDNWQVCPLEDSPGNCATFFLQGHQFTQKFYAVVSPRIGYQFNRHWQIALTLDNVFDRHYYQTLGNSMGGTWYGEPRNFLVRVDGRY